MCQLPQPGLGHPYLHSAVSRPTVNQSVMLVGPEAEHEVPCFISGAPENIQITPIFPQSRPRITRAWASVGSFDHPKCQAKVPHTRSLLPPHGRPRGDVSVPPCQPANPGVQIPILVAGRRQEGDRLRGKVPLNRHRPQETAKPHSPPLPSETRIGGIFPR